MPKGRSYDIFPRTFKARLLLAAVLLGGYPAIMLATILTLGTALTLGPIDSEQEGRIDFTVANETGGELVVLLDREVWGTVGEDGWRFSTYEWYGRRLVQVGDGTGRILFMERLSLDDLERMDYRITIEGR
jgi:hypothetical protein